MLHRVTNEVVESQRRYVVTPKKLEELIEKYQSLGYEFVSMSEVEQRMCGKNPNKFIAVTLDDGYEDTYTEAYPIFQKYNIPFCVYIAEGPITGEVCPEQLKGYRMLNAEMIKELAKSPYCTIGSHTKSHAALDALSDAEQEAEVKHCKEWLERIIERPVVDFAYPYGKTNGRSERIVSKIGIERAVLAGGGDVLNHTPSLKWYIPRVVVTNSFE